MAGDMKTEIGRVSARSRLELKWATDLVKRSAVDSADERMLLDMLGLLPQEKPQCSECGRPGRNLRVTELTPAGACGRCHAALRSKKASAARWESA